MLLILIVFQSPKGIGTLATLEKWRRSPAGYKPSTDLSVMIDIDSPMVLPSGDSLDMAQTWSDPLPLLFLFVLLTCCLFHEVLLSPPPAWRSLLFLWVRLVLFGSVIPSLNILAVCTLYVSPFLLRYKVPESRNAAICMYVFSTLSLVQRSHPINM